MMTAAYNPKPNTGWESTLTGHDLANASTARGLPWAVAAARTAASGEPRTRSAGTTMTSSRCSIMWSQNNAIA